MSVVSISYEAFRDLSYKYETLNEKYINIKRDMDEIKSKYEIEKIEHCYTKARVIFAMHILNGNRDDKVEDFMTEKDKEIRDLKIKIKNLEDLIFQDKSSS